MLLVMLLAGLLISYGVSLQLRAGAQAQEGARHRPRQATMPHRLASE